MIPGRLRRRPVDDNVLFGPDSPGLWAQALLLAFGLAAVVALASTRLGFNEYDYLVGAAAAAAMGLLLLLVLGPSRIVITLFLVFMIASHEHSSAFVLPFGGIEWHPRELLLFVLLAHLGAKLVLGKADIRPDLMHYFFYLYAFFFAFIAARGALRQPDLQRVISECRYPVFLASYFVFAACLSKREDAGYYLRLVFGLTMLIAAAGVAFFFYTILSGHIVSVYTPLGAFIQRQIGPFLLQSVRPNGHIFFEAAAIVLVSLLFCPEVSRWRRLFFAAALSLLLFAILITMMRTAYVTLFFSLAMLVVLVLPKELQLLTIFLGAAAVAVFLVIFGFKMQDALLGYIPQMEASLRGRFVEIEGAMQLFRRNPILGTGMGSSFRGMGFVAKNVQFSVAQADYQTVHNVWIYYLFKGGMFGMLLVLLGLGGMITRAYGLLGRLPLRERYLMRGLLAAWLGQLVASLAMPRLTYPIGGVLLAMMAAVFLAMARAYPRDEEARGAARKA